jgi:hypothetical protein
MFEMSLPKNSDQFIAKIAQDVGIFDGMTELTELAQIYGMDYYERQKRQHIYHKAHKIFVFCATRHQASDKTTESADSRKEANARDDP